MNPNLRKTLMGSAIVVLASSPAWSAEDPATNPGTIPQSEAVPQGDAVQPLEAAPGADTPMPVAPSERAPGMASPDTAVGGNPLYARTPEDLRDLEVVDVAGKEFGKVKAVVLGPDGRSAHAVIASGGFMGLGAREIVVSLDDLQLLDGRLQTSASAADVSAGGNEHDSDQYVELDPDRPISEFSAFEPIRQ